MRAIAEFSTPRLLLTLVVGVLGGVQVGLYMADWYDDGIAEPLSLWIGTAILVIAFVLGMLPFIRNGRGNQ